MSHLNSPVLQTRKLFKNRTYFIFRKFRHFSQCFSGPQTHLCLTPGPALLKEEQMRQAAAAANKARQ